MKPEIEAALDGVSASVDGYDCASEVEAFLATIRAELEASVPTADYLKMTALVNEAQATAKQALAALEAAPDPEEVALLRAVRSAAEPLSCYSPALRAALHNLAAWQDGA